MSHCQFRMAGGEENDKTLSEFVGLTLKDDSVGSCSSHGQGVSDSCRHSSRLVYRRSM